MANSFTVQTWMDSHRGYWPVQFICTGHYTNKKKTRKADEFMFKRGKFELES